MIVHVRVIPRARKSQFGGERNGAIVVRLAAPPVDNAANEALVTFLSESLGVTRNRVTIVSGERSRDKRVDITGITREQLLAVASA